MNRSGRAPRTANRLFVHPIAYNSPSRAGPPHRLSAPATPGNVNSPVRFKRRLEET